MDEISGLIIKMTEFFSGDPKRIQHFIKVHTFARVIGRAEGLDIRTMYCLDVASVVNDIGIKPAEERYGKGHCGGKLQEQLGPEPAQKMLRELDWQILLEADFLVNAYEDSLSKESIKSFRDKVFKTKAGIKMLEDMYGVRYLCKVDTRVI